MSKKKFSFCKVSSTKSVRAFGLTSSRASRWDSTLYNFRLTGLIVQEVYSTLQRNVHGLFCAKRMFLSSIISAGNWTAQSQYIFSGVLRASTSKRGTKALVSLRKLLHWTSSIVSQCPYRHPDRWTVLHSRISCQQRVLNWASSPVLASILKNKFCRGTSLVQAISLS